MGVYCVPPLHLKAVPAAASMYTTYPAANIANHAGNIVSPGAVPKSLNLFLLRGSQKVSSFVTLIMKAATTTAVIANLMGVFGICRHEIAIADIFLRGGLLFQSLLFFVFRFFLERGFWLFIVHEKKNFFIDLEWPI
jgi:hypothetical protein